MKIYVDGKLVAEGIQGATSKRWDIDNVEGQTVTYETIAQPHNEHNQTATWSEIGELTIEAGKGKSEGETVTATKEQIINSSH